MGKCARDQRLRLSVMQPIETDFGYRVRDKLCCTPHHVGSVPCRASVANDLWLQWCPAFKKEPTNADGHRLSFTIANSR